MGEDSVAAGLQEIDRELSQLVAGDAEPYSAGWSVWRTAFPLAPKSPDVMWPLWLMWGALTDLIEVEPERTAEVEALMLGCD